MGWLHTARTHSTRPQAEALATFFVSGQKCRVCAQTLRDTVWIRSLIREEQLSEHDVQAAKVEGLTCPALVELVCEALGGSGTEPMRL